MKVHIDMDDIKIQRGCLIKKTALFLIFQNYLFGFPLFFLNGKIIHCVYNRLNNILPSPQHKKDFSTAHFVIICLGSFYSSIERIFYTAK